MHMYACTNKGNEYYKKLWKMMNDLVVTYAFYYVSFLEIGYKIGFFQGNGEGTGRGCGNSVNAK